MVSPKHTIYVFGIQPLSFPRDLMFLRGMAEGGWNILESVHTPGRFNKYKNIITSASSLKKSDAVVYVSYLGNIVVPIVKILSQKLVIYNALNSMYESVILDRGQYPKYSLHALLFWLMDFLAFRFADLILLETEAQIDFVEKIFFVDRKKMIRVWTSADDEVFYPGLQKNPDEVFKVLFRGGFLPFVGLDIIIETARILEKENIQITLLGRGLLSEPLKKQLERQPLSNLTLCSEFLSPDDLRTYMLTHHLMLGQFGNHPRTQRTIANKHFEALALGIPIITGNSRSIRELFSHKETAFLVTCGDAQELASAIKVLKNDIVLRNKLAISGRKLFLDRLSPTSLIEGVLGKIKTPSN